MPRGRQQSLIPSTSDLVERALDKVRRAGVLDGQEQQALEAAVAGDLQRSRVAGWDEVVATWRREYEAACGTPPPRFTDVEGRSLKTAMQRAGSAKRLCELIPAFFRWRKTSEWAGMTDPTPVGLVKQLPRVSELLGCEETSTRRREESRRRAEAEQERHRHELLEQPSPAVEPASTRPAGPPRFRSNAPAGPMPYEQGQANTPKAEAAAAQQIESTEARRSMLLGQANSLLIGQMLGVPHEKEQSE